MYYENETTAKKVEEILKKINIEKTKFNETMRKLGVDVVRLSRINEEDKILLSWLPSKEISRSGQTRISVGHQLVIDKISKAKLSDNLLFTGTCKMNYQKVPTSSSVDGTAWEIKDKKISNEDWEGVTKAQDGLMRKNKVTDDIRVTNFNKSYIINPNYEYISKNHVTLDDAETLSALQDYASKNNTTVDELITKLQAYKVQYIKYDNGKLKFYVDRSEQYWFENKVTKQSFIYFTIYDNPNGEFIRDTCYELKVKVGDKEHEKLEYLSDPIPLGNAKVKKYIDEVNKRRHFHFKTGALPEDWMLKNLPSGVSAKLMYDVDNMNNQQLYDFWYSGMPVDKANIERARNKLIKDSETNEAFNELVDSLQVQLLSNKYGDLKLLYAPKQITDNNNKIIVAVVQEVEGITKRKIGKGYRFVGPIKAIYERYSSGSLLGYSSGGSLLARKEIHIKKPQMCSPDNIVKSINKQVNDKWNYIGLKLEACEPSKKKHSNDEVVINNDMPKQYDESKIPMTTSNFKQINSSNNRKPENNINNNNNNNNNKNDDGYYDDSAWFNNPNFTQQTKRNHINIISGGQVKDVSEGNEKEERKESNIHVKEPATVVSRMVAVNRVPNNNDSGKEKKSDFSRDEEKSQSVSEVHREKVPKGSRTNSTNNNKKKPKDKKSSTSLVSIDNRKENDSTVKLKRLLKEMFTVQNISKYMVTIADKDALQTFADDNNILFRNVNVYWFTFRDKLIVGDFNCENKAMKDSCVLNEYLYNFLKNYIEPNEDEWQLADKDVVNDYKRKLIANNILECEKLKNDKGSVIESNRKTEGLSTKKETKSNDVKVITNILDNYFSIINIKGLIGSKRDTLDMLERFSNAENILFNDYTFEYFYENEIRGLQENLEIHFWQLKNEIFSKNLEFDEEEKKIINNYKKLLINSIRTALFTEQKSNISTPSRTKRIIKDNIESSENNNDSNSEIILQSGPSNENGHKDTKESVDGNNISLGNEINKKPEKQKSKEVLLKTINVRKFKKPITKDDNGNARNPHTLPSDRNVGGVNNPQILLNEEARKKAINEMFKISSKGKKITINKVSKQVFDEQNPKTHETDPVVKSSETNPVGASYASPKVDTVEANSVSPKVDTARASSASPIVDPARASSASPKVDPARASSASPKVAPARASSASPKVDPVEANSVSPKVDPVEANSVSPKTNPVGASYASPKTGKTNIIDRKELFKPKNVSKGDANIFYRKRTTPTLKKVLGVNNSKTETPVVINNTNNNADGTDSINNTNNNTITQAKTNANNAIKKSIIVPQQSTTNIKNENEIQKSKLLDVDKKGGTELNSSIPVSQPKNSNDNSVPRKNNPLLQVSQVRPEVRTEQQHLMVQETDPVGANYASPKVDTVRASSVSPKVDPARASSASPKVDPVGASSVSPKVDPVRASYASPKTGVIKANSKTQETNPVANSSETSPVEANSVSPKTNPVGASYASPKTGKTNIIDREAIKELFKPKNVSKGDANIFYRKRTTQTLKKVLGVNNSKKETPVVINNTNNNADGTDSINNTNNTNNNTITQAKTNANNAIKKSIIVSQQSTTNIKNENEIRKSKLLDVDKKGGTELNSSIPVSQPKNSNDNSVPKKHNPLREKIMFSGDAITTITKTGLILKQKISGTEGPAKSENNTSHSNNDNNTNNTNNSNNNSTDNVNNSNIDNTENNNGIKTININRIKNIIAIHNTDNTKNNEVVVNNTNREKLDIKKDLNPRVILRNQYEKDLLSRGIIEPEFIFTFLPHDKLFKKLRINALSEGNNNLELRDDVMDSLEGYMKNYAIYIPLSLLGDNSKSNPINIMEKSGKLRQVDKINCYIYFVQLLRLSNYGEAGEYDAKDLDDKYSNCIDRNCREGFKSIIELVAEARAKTPSQSSEIKKK